MKLNFSIFKREIGIIISSRHKRDEPVQGVTNRCKDGLYVVFLDYDHVPVDWVCDEINSIQKEFMLGDFHIFQSSPDSFHAVCFDKVTREVYERILARSSCDPLYRKIPFVWGKRLNTLRVSDKKGDKVKYRLTLKGENQYRKESKAHRDFFSKYYGFIVHEKEDDGVNDIILATYRV